MSATKESSVLFSLHELMDLERDRIEAERAERVRSERALAEAKAAAARRALQAEHARVREAEEAVLREQERRREERARLEAIKLAEIQRAKSDADHWARLEAARIEHEHVQKLQALRADKGKQKLLYGVIGAVSLLAVGAVAGGVLLKQLDDEAETARLALEANNRERDALLGEGERLRREQAVLDQRYKAAKTEAERLQLQQDEARIEAERARIESQLKSRHAAAPVTRTSSKPKEPCRCPPGDPMCACN